MSRYSGKLTPDIVKEPGLSHFTLSMKKLLFVLALLLLPGLAQASVSYERSPAGFSITSPVIASVSAASFDELCFGEFTPTGFWTIKARKEPEGDYYQANEFYLSTSLDVSFTLDLPIQTYQAVSVFCQNTDQPDEFSSQTIDLEFDDNETIFEIIEPTIPQSSGNILTIPSTFATGMLAYAGRLFLDLQVWILVIVGLPVGFYVIEQAVEKGQDWFDDSDVKEKWFEDAKDHGLEDVEEAYERGKKED
jgi:hypothetical protein